MLLSGCQPEFNQKDPLPALDEPYFRCHVQSVLTKTCSMFACHGADGTNGTTSRYYRVYARNRLRTPDIPEANRGAPLTAAERAANFVATRAIVDTQDRAASYLLQKPLDQQAGGYFHRGAEIFMQGDVFLLREDPDFQVLVNWVNGAKENAQCIEPGSDM